MLHYVADFLKLGFIWKQLISDDFVSEFNVLLDSFPIAELEHQGKLLKVF